MRTRRGFVKCTSASYNVKRVEGSMVNFMMVLKNEENLFPLVGIMSDVSNGTIPEVAEVFEQRSVGRRETTE